MSRENVEAAGRFWQRFSASGASGWIDDGAPDPVLHPDVRYVEDARWPGAGVYSGPVGRARAVCGVPGDLPPHAGHAPRDLRPGRQVGLVFGSRGQSIQTGLPFEHEWAYLFTFSDGLVVEWRVYFDKSEALEAMGVRDAGDLTPPA